MALVEAKRTPWTRAGLLADIEAALREATGLFPYRAQMALLVGEFSHECYPLGRSCYGFNVGNISGSWEGAYHTLGANIEYDKFGQPYADPGHRFRDYPSFAVAVADYLRLIRGHYPRAWAELIKAAPNPAGYVGMLKAGGYFTGPVEAYVAAVARFALDTLKAPDEEWPSPPPRPSQPEEPITTPETPSSKSVMEDLFDPRIHAPVIESTEAEHTPEPYHGDDT